MNIEHNNDMGRPKIRTKEYWREYQKLYARKWRLTSGKYAPFRNWSEKRKKKHIELVKKWRLKNPEWLKQNYIKNRVKRLETAKKKEKNAQSFIEIDTENG